MDAVALKDEFWARFEAQHPEHHTEHAAQMMRWGLDSGLDSNNMMHLVMVFDHFVHDMDTKTPVCTYRSFFDAGVALARKWEKKGIVLGQYVDPVVMVREILSDANIHLRLG